MQIAVVPCLEDNYAYLIICEKTMLAAVVDPAEAAPVLALLEGKGVELASIWNTHHHFDHVGGNKELLDAFPQCQVVGHISDKGRIPGQSTFAEQGDVVTVGKEVSASIIFNPGHTSGAISYYLKEPGAVFTGDTLFAAGCGRLFEGTPEQMHDSLSRLAALPSETKVFCGHEYTQASLKFASAVESENPDIVARIKLVDEMRAGGQPSMGFTIAEECATNPFLRTTVPAVIASAKKEEKPDDDRPASIFASLRRWKDRF